MPTLLPILLPLLFALLLPAAPPPEAAPEAYPTAREAITRIQQALGMDWSEDTVDTFKAGDPDTPVTGIAVTMMATYDVLQRAAAEGHNLIITHEPTFYGHRDETAVFEATADPVYAAKQALIARHGLVIWRFHDYWHLRRPDGILAGMLGALGWADLPRAADGPPVFTLPEATTVAALARTLRDQLGIRTLRALGDGAMPVRRVALLPGAAGFGAHRALLARDDVDVLVIGEAPEWETALYVDDAVAAGLPKALIELTHIPSEQAGMAEAVRWMTPLFPDVPVVLIPAREPFWTP